MNVPKPLLAAAGLLERLLCRAAAGLLPWSGHSTDTSWLTGYREGSADGYARGYLAAQRERSTS